MNSSSEVADVAYYDCLGSEGGSQITPTMVSNFSLPNSNLCKDGPYLKIIEQPQTKFRFRYKSEMVGTHGQLKAESADKNKNIFPTVKLCNWNKGPTLIRLMLYTADENVNVRKRHVHELNGKNCNKEGFTGGCEVVVDDENNYTAQFSNLGIIHIARRDVQNIIFLRKKEELINQTCMNNPGLRNESIQHNIPPTKLQKLKEEAEEEAKKMDLNKVVLRFQAFYYDTKANFYRPITDYVDSDVILNLKNASTGELKIVRISTVSSPCTGRTEVWMLVEKVKKNNVRIKFYELDSEGREVWKDYGVFKESDVHHQYAIVFQTPAYRFTNIREPVHVKVQLERKPDYDTSEPMDFTFLPETMKRSNIYIDSGLDTELNYQKRFRRADMEAINLKKQENLFLGSGEQFQHPYSPETNSQSPSHMVPSPMTPADSPSSQEFYSPPRRSSTNQPAIIISGNGEEVILNNFHVNEESMQGETGFGNYQLGTIRGVNLQQQIYINDRETQNGYLTTQVDCDPIMNSGHLNQASLSPGYQVPSPGSNGYGSPMMASPGSVCSYNNEQAMLGSACDNALTQIQQFDAVQMQVMNSKTQMPNATWDFNDFMGNSNDMQADEDIDLLDIMNDSKFFAISKDFSDIQADCARLANKYRMKPSNSKVKTESNDLEFITKGMSNVVVDENKNTASTVHQSVDTVDNKISIHMALLAATRLLKYKDTGNVGELLATHRNLLCSTNKFGENVLHEAVRMRSKESLKKILKVSPYISASDIVISQNSQGQTPLHLAVLSGQVDIVQELLNSSLCDLKLVDNEGNSVLHLCMMIPKHGMSEIIFNHSSSTSEKLLSKILNSYNYQGETALHLAVQSNCLENVNLALKNGADVHLCEKKQGANPLHLSVMGGRHDMAQFLIKNTSVTVNARMLNGNTALHIAAEMADAKMCSLLMQANANPNMMNYIREKSNENESNETDKEPEDEDNEDEEQDKDKTDKETKTGCTVFDYAGDNKEILQILKKQDVSE